MPYNFDSRHRLARVGKSGNLLSNSEQHMQHRGGTTHGSLVHAMDSIIKIKGRYFFKREERVSYTNACHSKETVPNIISPAVSVERCRISVASTAQH